MNKFIKLSDGTLIPRLGQGIWYLGENNKTEDNEIKGIRIGIENGMALIDTADCMDELVEQGKIKL